MAPIEQREVLGKWVQVIMDSDHSAKFFSGKGKIVHIFSNPPAKEAIAIEFAIGDSEGRFQKESKSVPYLRVSIGSKLQLGRYPHDRILCKSLETQAIRITVPGNILFVGH